MPRLPKKFFRRTDKVWQVLAENDFKVRTPQAVICKHFSTSDLRYLFSFDFDNFRSRC
jgi:hypothetical protein